jgi:hypothetical protein
MHERFTRFMNGISASLVRGRLNDRRRPLVLGWRAALPVGKEMAAVIHCPRVRTYFHRVDDDLVRYCSMQALDARATATGLTGEGDIRSEAEVPIYGVRRLRRNTDSIQPRSAAIRHNQIAVIAEVGTPQRLS